MPATILSDNGVSSGSSGIKTTGANDGILALQTTTAGGTATTAVTIGTDQSVTFAQSANLPNTFGFKNRIINGGMVIDQRNAGASVTVGAGDTYCVDRWFGSATQASKFTVQQNAGSVTPPAGFTNYLGATSSSAYSVTGNDAFQIAQIIEGFNVSDLNWGTANASPATLSFWVRSSLTGTFGGSIATTKTAVWVMPFSYTISSANTWTYITVSITAPTSTGGTNNNNTAGVFVRFGLGSAGTSAGGTAGTWTSAGNYIQPASTVSVVGTNGATFYITGVQLEKGSTATSFDYRPYGTEFALCQRYFIKWAGNSITGFGYPMIGTGNISSSTLANIFIPTPVALRATPTVSFSGSVSINEGGTQSSLTSVSTVYDASGTGFWTTLAASGGAFTFGNSAIVFTQNASTNSFSASSEL
jgi:hypothetical protein